MLQCDSSLLCQCSPSWAADDCSSVLLIAATPCSTSAVDFNGTCCPDGAGVDAFTGRCCVAGSTMDEQGRCCGLHEPVDACGVCGGDGVVIDVLGNCCRHPLPPSGQCCSDGILDSCGVCGGMNECNATVISRVPSGSLGSASVAVIAAGLGVPAVTVSPPVATTVGVRRRVCVCADVVSRYHQILLGFGCGQASVALT